MIVINKLNQRLPFYSDLNRPSHRLIKLFLGLVMASTIQLFQTVRELYQTMEIWESQPKRIPSWLNLINFFYFLFIILMIITSTAYFLFSAQSAQEYSDTFYVAITTTTFIFGIFISIFQIANIATLIQNFDAFIQQSKFYFIYLF